MSKLCVYGDDNHEESLLNIQRTRNSNSSSYCDDAMAAMARPWHGCADSKWASQGYRCASGFIAHALTPEWIRTDHSKHIFFDDVL
jgi:hypothetical protein